MFKISLSPFLKPVGNDIPNDKPLRLTLQKTYCKNLQVYTRGSQSFQKNISENIIINKDSSPTCPRCSPVKMYYGLHDFFIFIIIFSSIVSFLQPSSATVNWLIEKICWVHWKARKETELRDANTHSCKKRVKSHKKLLLHPVNLAKWLAEG